MNRAGIITVFFCIISFMNAGHTLGFQGYAEMSVSPGDIVWHPLVSNGGVTLSVTGPGGTYIRREHGAGDSPSIQLSDSAGNVLPDGQYSYELVFAPASGTLTRYDTQSLAASEGEPVVQSGSFRVLYGQFISPASDEAAGGKRTAAADVISPLNNVVPDNQIVQGSLCVGLDCVSGESFGFDTIRLKENNLRIKFEDTSISAGFPTNDWQITANDSASGGANYLAIEDITGAKVPVKVIAGSPNNSLYVASSGRVGFGTATPVLDLHVNKSDTPSIRLEQNTSGGWTAQTWDIAGNESNFFIRDVTAGSKLSFRIQPGAPTNSLTIKSDGKVGIGTWSPDAMLKVESTLFPSEKVRRTVDFTSGGRGVSAIELKSNGDMVDGFGPSLEFWMSDNTYTASAGVVTMEGVRDGGDNSGKWILRTANAGSLGARLVVNKSGNVGIGITNPTYPLQLANGALVTAGGVWQDASSRAYKQNIRELSATDASEVLDGLAPVTFAYKTDPAESHVGFIAEDVPALVASRERKGLSPMDIVAVLTKVIQEQKKTIGDLRDTVSGLSAKLDALERSAIGTLR